MNHVANIFPTSDPVGVQANVLCDEHCQRLIKFNFIKVH